MAQPAPNTGLPPASLRTFYAVQFLASWAVRTADTSQVLFLAAAFPGTLFYISIYGLVKSLVAVSLSSSVGAATDTLDRLRVMRLCIAAHRLAVAASCLLFAVLMLFGTTAATWFRHALFAALVVLGSLEKLASVANTVAIERDWVIVIVETSSVQRHDLNARLRRIDLLTKLVSPFFVSLLDTVSPPLAIATVMIMNVVSVYVEFRATRRIYDSIPQLASREAVPQPASPVQLEDEDDENEDLLQLDSEASDSLLPPPPPYRPSTHPAWLPRSLAPWHDYARSPVFLASFSNSVLYWTVLTFGGQTTTFLLSSGYTPLHVSFFRIGSVIAELVGTWLSPFLMQRVGPVKAGLWNLLWQVACIGPFAGSILSPTAEPKTVGALLSAGITLKRPGLSGSDLATQFIVQEATPDASRMQFSSTEMACQNLFEMLSMATTAIFSRPEDFRFPVFISYAVLIASTVLFARFATKNRGMAFHIPPTGGSVSIGP